MLSLTQAARLLDAELKGQDLCFSAVSTDSRHLQPGELFIALQGSNFDGHEFIAAARERGACAALVSHFSAVDLPQLRVADTRLALGCLGAAWRSRFHRPVVGLTGSNGKTTVKEMVAAILRCCGRVLATQGNLNNDIGVPLTLLRLSNDYDYAVVELGANHLGEVAYLTQLARPTVAILNNAGPAHLEGFGSLAGVAQGKGEIFQGLPPQGVAIINCDDVYADYWRGLVNGRRVIDFGLDHSAQVSGQIVDETHNRFRLTALGESIEIELPLPGRHNVRNALAAAAASVAVGATLVEVRQGLEAMQEVDSRFQQLAGAHGSTLINDTYNANPGSLAAALYTVSMMPGSKWLVLGDMAELGPQAGELHAQIGEQARTAGFQRLYSFGNYSQQAALAFGTGGMHFKTLGNLIQTLIDALCETDSKPTLLIKGSRSMRMERVVQSLLPESQHPKDQGAHS